MKKRWDMGSINKKIQEFITPKVFAVILTFIYAISLVPLLLIGMYNCPSADDYTNGSRCYHVWEETRSVFAVLIEAFSRMKEEWISWRGTFTSSFLSALTPNIWGEEFYVLTTVIVLLALTFTMIYFFRTLLVNIFQADKYTSYSVAILVLLVSVHCLEESGRVEAFYWYSGAINYTFLYSLSLLFYSVMISAVFVKGKKRAGKLTLASVLGFLVGGGNLLTALNTVIVMVLVLAGMFITKKYREYKAFLIPIFFLLLGFLLNVIAPGNAVRAAATSGMNPIKAILVSFYYCLDYCIGEWTGWPVILMVVLLVFLFWHMTEKTKFEFPCPVLFVLLGYCIVSAMMTPTLFATGNIEAARIKALTFMMYILVLALCTLYVTGWARKNIGRNAVHDNTSVERTPDQFSKNTVWGLVSALFFFMAASVITVIPEPHYFTATSAMTDVISGDAAVYERELLKRVELYESGEKNIVVEPLSVRPVLLYFSDIKEEAGDWENRGLCRYYGLESVRVSSEESK